MIAGLLVLGATPVVAGAASEVAGPTFVTGVLAMSLAAIAVVAIRANPRATVAVLLGYLLVLGVLRRLLGSAVGDATNDPLILVGPAVAGFLVLVAVQRKQVRIDSPLSVGVVALTAMAVLWALNPFAGTLAAGLSSLIFFLAPMLWFWIGKAYVNDRLLRQLLVLLAAFALLSAAYAFVQVFSGFPSWDRRWINERGYAALNVGGATRPFGLSTASSEMTTLLFVGSIVMLFSLPKLPVPVRVIAVSALFFALVLAASRTPVLLFGVVVGALMALRAGGARRLLLAPVLVAIALVGLNWAVHRVDVEALDPRIQPFVGHVVLGLQDPTNEEVSTGSIHIELVASAVQAPLDHPLGSGQQVVTLAGSRFSSSGASSRSAEFDLGNVAVAFGIPGLVAYLIVAVAGFRQGFTALKARPRSLALAALGILFVTFGFWLNGSAYGAAPLGWLILGWLDQPAQMNPACEGPQAEERVPA